MSFEDLAAAYRKVSRQLAESGIRVFWGPIANDYFSGFPGDVGFMPWSKDKPVIFGSTLGEFPMVKLTPEEKEAMSEEDKISFLKEKFGAEADRLITLFRDAYQKHDVLDLAYMDSMVRIPTLKAASKHAESGNNNTFIFLAAYNAPEDGWVPLWHGGEVCYIFMNEDRVFALNEAIYGRKLANIFSTMALNYAKFGDPNNKYLPKWNPFTNEHRYTMIIDRECECREAYDEELIELHSKVSRDRHLDRKTRFLTVQRTKSGRQKYGCLPDFVLVNALNVIVFRSKIFTSLKLLLDSSPYYNMLSYTFSYWSLHLAWSSILLCAKGHRVCPVRRFHRQLCFLQRQDMYS